MVKLPSWDDDYGQYLLDYLNMNNVQTRSTCIDSKGVTAASQMKIGRRGGLRTKCVKACAEDSLSMSEINIDVLREVRDSNFIGKVSCDLVLCQYWSLNCDFLNFISVGFIVFGIVMLGPVKT